jgi:tetrahedral aminopeptidase
MDKTRIGEILKQLTALDGLSGVEGKLSEVVKALAEPFTSEIRGDALGNLIALRPGASPEVQPRPRVMIAAHMDEIGLIVTKVEQGFLHVSKVGGVDPRTALGQEVVVHASGPGSEAFPDGLPGYIGSRPPHLLAAGDYDKVIPMDQLRVDLGRPTAFFEQGIVRVGDRIAFRGPYTELLGGRIATKALDNRASVTAMLGALGYLAERQHTWDVLAVATTQEEIGLRGAITSAWELQPDLAIAIDVTFGNTPGVNGAKTVEMDKGPAIAVGPNLHPGLVKQLRETADGMEMSYVIEPTPGASGTDAWAIQVSRAGVPTALVSVPIRYMHSPVELVAISDIDRVARLVAAFIAGLDSNTISRLADELS